MDPCLGSSFLGGAKNWQDAWSWGQGRPGEGWLAFNRGRNSHRGRGVGTLAGMCGIGRVQTLPVDCFCVGDVGSKAPTERGPWRGCWRPQEEWRKMG